MKLYTLKSVLAFFGEEAKHLSNESLLVILLVGLVCGCTGECSRCARALRLRFTGGSHDEFRARVETTHLDRGIQLLRKCAKDAHPEPRCGAELEIRRKPPTFVAHRKFDLVIGATRDPNPDV